MYIQREKKFHGRDDKERAAAAFAAHMSGNGAHEYAVGARIEDGDVVVDRWVSQTEAIALGAAYEPTDAVTLAECLGCSTTFFEAPTPVVPEVEAEDPDTARRRRVAKHLPRDERIARGFGTEEDHAEVARERRQADALAAQETESMRRGAIAAGLRDGSIDDARALMTDAERERFDAQWQRKLGRAAEPVIALDDSDVISEPSP